MFVTRHSVDALIRQARHAMEDPTSEPPDLASALTHYLGSVPGTWRLITVVVDQHYREFYWTATKEP